MVIKTQFFKARVNHVVDQTPCIRSIQLEVPPDYPDFLPGQVVRLHIKDPDILEPLPIKQYSICSLTEDRVIELCIDRVNERGVSGRLHHYNKGEYVLISPPSGRFILKLESDLPPLFIGLGSGVGVMMGMMRQYFHHRKNKMPVQFYAANSDETVIPYESKLEAYSEKYPDLEVYPILQTDGYDTDEIMNRILSHTARPASWEIYLAGPKRWVEELRNHLLDVGFSDTHFHSLGYS